MIYRAVLRQDQLLVAAVFVCALVFICLVLINLGLRQSIYNLETVKNNEFNKRLAFEKQALVQKSVSGQKDENNEFSIIFKNLSSLRLKVSDGLKKLKEAAPAGLKTAGP